MDSEAKDFARLARRGPFDTNSYHIITHARLHEAIRPLWVHQQVALGAVGAEYTVCRVISQYSCAIVWRLPPGAGAKAVGSRVFLAGMLE